MTTHIHSPVAIAVPRRGRHLAWYAGGSVVAFLVPYLGVSVLGLQHDVFYGLYFAATLLMLAAYTRVEHIDVRRLFTRHWKSSVAVGVPTAAFVMWNVFRTDPGTPHPHGAYY